MYLEEGNKPKILLIILGAVIGAILGSLVTVAYYHGKIAKIQSQAGSSQSQVSNKTGPANVPVPPIMPIPNEVTTIFGTVEKIEGSNLTVKENFFSKTYTVKITDSAKIIKREMSQITPKPEEGKPPFNPFKETDAKLSDIRQNDSVVIEANENVKYKTEFEAKTVYIQIGNILAPEALKTIPAPVPDVP